MTASKYLSSFADELTSKVGDVFRKMVDEERGGSLLKVPFYLYEKRQNTEFTLWCGGDGLWSFSDSVIGLRKYDSPPLRRPSASDRGGVLEDFLRLEFITNIILMMHAGVYHSDANPSFVFESYISLNMSRKIKLLKKYSILSASQIRSYERLAAYRNRIAHQLSVDATYANLKAPNQELSYLHDLEIVDDALKAAHLHNQNTLINYLLSI
jgi:hypothetical protein